MTDCAIIIPLDSRAARPTLDDALGADYSVEIIFVTDVGDDSACGDPAESDSALIDAGAVEAAQASPRRARIRVRTIRAASRVRDGGFLAACNAGAAAASAPYVIFLRSDVRPRAGWLDALLRAALASPAVAIVGSKHVGPGNTLLHAGVVVGQDRWPRPVYAGFPADHPAVNRTRRFQMVSAASLLVRRDAFEAAGGFDPEFAPEHGAYDLCLRVGERGHEVHVAHESVVDDAGTAAENAAMEDVRSLRRFRIRWGRTLRRDDVAYFLEDRLLDVRYDVRGPRQIVVSPLLAHDGQDTDESESDGVPLLAARSRQVQALLDEQRRLQLRIVDLERAQRAWDDASASDGHGERAQARADGRRSDADAEADPMPPEALVQGVGGAFREAGDEFLQYFIDIAGLRPDERVLDVGCGVGRMATALTRYLRGGAGGGSYEGFDVMAEAIDWCRSHITPRHPTFRFQHVNVGNRYYNPAGAEAAGGFHFPYDAATFDFVYLTSVFTHMLPAEVQHYVSEIARVLDRGGRCLCTFFLLNDVSIGLSRESPNPAFHFQHVHDGYRTTDPAMPEAAVAYDEACVRGWFADHGLTLDRIDYGWWSGRRDGLSLQDIVLAVKA
jgi:SAM-dependent methyltransferase